MKKFTSVNDIASVDDMVRQAIQVKDDPFANADLGNNKVLGLLFFNPSLRTRMSVQRAAMNLGMDVMVINLNRDTWQLEFADGTVMDHGRQEHIREAAPVIGQYCDIVGIRTFPTLQDRETDYSDHVINSFIGNMSVPVISLESAILHPLQSFADAITIEEHKKRERPKVVLSWAPHPRALPQAVANSFVEWISRTDAELVVTNPEGYDLAPEFLGDTPVLHDQREAFRDADFIYAKNWSSYTNYGEVARGKEEWIIGREKMNLTNSARFMHCLPVRRNVVVRDEVLDSDASLVIEQANNRIWSAQTILLNMLRDEK